jgi:DNA-binding MarR family transcriptional regulator
MRETVSVPAFPAQASETQVDAVLDAIGVLLRIAAHSVIEVENMVTTPQLRILVMIASDGPQSVTAVAQELGIHSSNATRTCERLVRQGLIRRTRQDEDRRVVRLDLTAKGVGVVTHVLQERRNDVADLLGALDGDERQRVTEALAMLARAAGGKATHDARIAFSLPR